jgi:hypothetical protein
MEEIHILRNQFLKNKIILKIKSFHKRKQKLCDKLLLKKTKYELTQAIVTTAKAPATIIFLLLFFVGELSFIFFSL